MISILVSIYNTSKFLDTCIQSVMYQSYTDWEIILVDDASKDNSLIIIKKLLKKYHIQNKCKVIHHNKNCGYGKSLKDAIKNSTGDLIAVLDSDDALYSNSALKIMRKMHDKNPGCSLCYSKYYVCNSNLEIIRQSNSKDLKGKSFLDVKSGVSHLKVFKKKYYDKTCGFDPKLRKSVDKDIILKLEDVGDLVFIDQLLYMYREHNNSITSRWCKPKKKIQANKIRNKIFKNAQERRAKLRNS